MHQKPFINEALSVARQYFLPSPVQGVDDVGKFRPKIPVLPTIQHQLINGFRTIANGGQAVSLNGKEEREWVRWSKGREGGRWRVMGAGRISKWNRGKGESEIEQRAGGRLVEGKGGRRYP